MLESAVDRAEQALEQVARGTGPAERAVRAQGLLGLLLVRDRGGVGLGAVHWQVLHPVLALALDVVDVVRLLGQRDDALLDQARGRLVVQVLAAFLKRVLVLTVGVNQFSQN